MIAHRARIPSCLPQAVRCAPSKATFRMASLSCFSGKYSQIRASQCGKASVEKKVPPNRSCGSDVRCHNPADHIFKRQSRNHIRERLNIYQQRRRGYNHPTG